MTVERILTGDPGLDAILDGGLPTNAIHLVIGPPGAGKTIFAQRVVFANATARRPAAYLTTLSEPFAKTLTYLQEFPFFDEAKVGEAVHYDDLAPALAGGGPDTALVAIEEVLKTHRPGLLVIDSFKAIQDLYGPLPDRRRWLYQLSGLLAAFRTTTLWLGEYGPDDLNRHPEFAVADGIIEFANEPVGPRDRRVVRVHKLRGSAFRSGTHAVRITAQGLRAWPRLVTPAVTPDYRTVRERLATGIPGLDELVEAGFWRGSATLVAGPSGSGKTALGLHFVLEGARQGEPGMFVHFQENPIQLANIIRGFGRDPGPDLAAGRLVLHYESPVELEVDALIQDVFARLRAIGARRLVLDALGDLAGAAGDPRRFHDYLYAIVQHCAAADIACLLTLETSNLLGMVSISEGTISPICDNILLLQLQMASRTERTLRVMKTRGSAHDPLEHALAITAGGPRVR
jgi:circadian clock protein KaiC